MYSLNFIYIRVVVIDSIVSFNILCIQSLYSRSVSVPILKITVFHRTLSLLLSYIIEWMVLSFNILCVSIVD